MNWLTHPLDEAGNNASQINLTEVNKQISEKWRTLSLTQREDITAISMQKIEEQRESRKLAAHSVPLNAFHDARSTIQSVETQVILLVPISSPVLKFCSWHSYTRELALNSCWWPVGQPQGTSPNHSHISQVIQSKDSSTHR